LTNEVSSSLLVMSVLPPSTLISSLWTGPTPVASQVLSSMVVL
jgi:hypothetical protein